MKPSLDQTCRLHNFRNNFMARSRVVLEIPVKKVSSILWKEIHYRVQIPRSLFVSWARLFQSKSSDLISLKFILIPSSLLSLGLQCFLPFWVPNQISVGISVPNKWHKLHPSHSPWFYHKKLSLSFNNNN